MIESEIKRKRLTYQITRWCEYTKVVSYLRERDIPSLVDSIIQEFYHTCLCCGHWVDSITDGIPLAFKENDGSEVQGSYCKDCAKRYKKKLGAWEIK